jgi:DNA polymerase-1
VVIRNGTNVQIEAAAEGGVDRAGPAGLVGRNAPAPSLLVDQQARLPAIVAGLDESRFVGLDAETTGLDPRADRVRLLSLTIDTRDGGRLVYVVDCFALDPSPLWEVLAEKELILHNAAFDLAFLARLGFTPAGRVHDTMILAQLVTAGTSDRNSLAGCCERFLGQILDKDLQKSDWSGDLTADQLAYAARDVEVLRPLHEALMARIRAEGMERIADIEERCLPALVWASAAGVRFDAERWCKLARDAEREGEELLRQLDADAPRRDGYFTQAGAWNWDSPAQVTEALEAAGCELTSTRDAVLARADHPLAELLRRYRAARKLAVTYGENWCKYVRKDGRIYPRWGQLGAAFSGRMSCSNPNLQQVPRGEHRKCFIAPPGHVLVKADYSQIELRIAAEIADERAMLEAFQKSTDLHTLTARRVLGTEHVSPNQRQLAKVVNFGLLYGMGARGLQSYAKAQYGLALSERQAHGYRSAFFSVYPGLAAWHQRVRQEHAVEVRTLAGRRRALRPEYSDALRLNTPVQGTGADGLKMALALLWERRGLAPGAVPVLIVHDEIVVECPAERAQAVSAWLRQAMLDGMQPLLQRVPVEVDVTVGRTWGGE